MPRSTPYPPIRCTPLRTRRRRVARRLHVAAHERGAHMSRHDHDHHDLHEHDDRGHARRGGRGGHHRQRARRGAIHSAVLTLLDERPMHGYELITELEERSGGRWRPSAGAIYPALTKMEARGLVTSEEIDGKRRFTLTPQGQEALAELRASRTADAPAPWEESGRGSRGDLRGHIAELAGQARQLARFGTSAQIDRAVDVFDDAKRKLYAILADDTDATTPGEADHDVVTPDPTADSDT